jgi:hypothetical protein
VSRVALADVLWDAANLYLVPPQAYNWSDKSQWPGSCCAVMQAIRPDWFERDVSLHGQADGMPEFDFLRSLGCETHTTEMNRQKDSQGVRYMWLLLAMHVAEDEGIEIERGAA